MFKSSVTTNFDEFIAKFGGNSPKVGIYWFIKDPKQKRNGEILISRKVEVVSMSQQVAGFIDSPFAHYSVWDSVVKEFPWLAGDEYEDWPRGRVLLNVDEKPFMFHIYLDAVLDKAKYKQIILTEFNIPDRGYVFARDSHYAEAKHAIEFKQYNDQRKTSQIQEKDWDF
jgi:hypothetical protein